MRRSHFLLMHLLIFTSIAYSQSQPKTLPAKRTVAAIKVDGKLDELCWKDSIFATKFVEWRPNFGAVEDQISKTEFGFYMIILPFILGDIVTKNQKIVYPKNW